MCVYYWVRGVNSGSHVKIAGGGGVGEEGMDSPWASKKAGTKQRAANAAGSGACHSIIAQSPWAITKKPKKPVFRTCCVIGRVHAPAPALMPAPPSHLHAHARPSLCAPPRTRSRTHAMHRWTLLQPSSGTEQSSSRRAVRKGRARRKPQKSARSASASIGMRCA